ncbi:MAG TPA: transposase [Anaerolineales bacterium]
MVASLLVVTPSPSFGEQIRRPLEETGKFHVHVVNSKAAAIVRADEESCRLAFLDLDLGDSWVEEVGQSLRTIIPGIPLFILAGEETLPVFESIRPWTLIHKPFNLPDVLQAIGPVAEASGSPAPGESPTHDMLWLSDVNKAAQHLTRLTLESSSQAALITRENVVWAYAGQLSQMAAQEVARVLARNWDAAKGGDLLRFARLEATKAEHMLYATQLTQGMLLAMVFDAETPFSTIRSQASQLATSLSEGETPEEQDQILKEYLEAAAPSIRELEEDDEALEMPPISEILKDIPIPDPRPAASSPRMQAAASEMLTDIPATDAGVVLPASQLQAPPLTPPAPAVETPPLTPQVREAPVSTPAPVDPGAATRPSAFSRETSMPLPVMQSSGAEASPSGLQPRPVMPVSSLDETVASRSVPRPETPVRLPQPGELDETRPASRVELSSSNLSFGPITLEPISAGAYQLSYACLLLPRFSSHFLTGDIADRLSEWIPIICVAFGWRLEYLAVRPEYLQWVVNVPPATSPGYVMRVLRQQLSDKIFSAFPRLKRDNPSGDFWAPGYLIMGGTQAHPPQLVKDYIRQIRQRQGIEKPQGAERSRR